LVDLQGPAVSPTVETNFRVDVADEDAFFSWSLFFDWCPPGGHRCPVEACGRRDQLGCAAELDQISQKEIPKKQ